MIELLRLDDEGEAVLAAYTVANDIRTIIVFLVWLSLLCVGIWLLIGILRNKNLLREHRALRIVVKVLLVLFALFLPILGVVVIFVVWFFTRSPGDELLDADTPRGPSATPSADGAAYSRPLPFPPPSAPRDTGT